ncbi:MAG TPA: helix-turn-helix domain-containing protein [Actinomycetes bacterium]|nr:helix-turn-helix domain-containing protein [Actinomycetes bacterium]
MTSTPASTVVSVIRLLDVVATAGSPSSYPGLVLPALAGAVNCDRVTYDELAPSGAVRRVDHVVTAAGAGGDARHRLTLTLVVPGRGLVGITWRRARLAFSRAEAELVDALRAPLATGVARAQGRLGQLTAREQQVLELVARGRTNVAIAHSLGISPRTVGKHLEHCYRKLAVSSRAAAVASLR